MKTAPGTIVVAILAVFFVIHSALAQEVVKAGKTGEAYQAREKAMQELAADSKKSIDSLKSLTKEQKNAVVALLAITRAAAAYESRFMKKDDKALRMLYGSLGQFSSAYRAPGAFQSVILGCFDATVSCLSAQKKCRGAGGSADECDGTPDVIESCANEAICFTSAFMKLHQGIPQILGGRDPWPPLPFPY
jgi:hypothetical protein